MDKSVECIFLLELLQRKTRAMIKAKCECLSRARLGWPASIGISLEMQLLSLGISGRKIPPECNLRRLGLDKTRLLGLESG